MQPLTEENLPQLAELQNRYQVSRGAITELLRALVAGHGTMAQFSHPDLGGSGQWMQGGMVMAGSMFDYALKAKIDGLCSELANLLTKQPALMEETGQSRPGGEAENWWEEDLGRPAATGSQNDIRYAYFPETKRLAVSNKGQLRIYDTADYQIHGVSQQQSIDSDLTFTSQRGPVRVSDLRPVSGHSAKASAPPAASGSEESGDTISKIERLAELRGKGIISEQEFTAKKAELLKRL
jgi:hypothetical protein